jgi:hypothetical protein
VVGELDHRSALAGYEIEEGWRTGMKLAEDAIAPPRFQTLRAVGRGMVHVPAGFSRVTRDASSMLPLVPIKGQHDLPRLSPSGSGASGHPHWALSIEDKMALYSAQNDILRPRPSLLELSQVHDQC